MLSTVDSVRMVETQDKQGKIKLKPECIVRYNSHMHVVDMADQYLPCILSLENNQMAQEIILLPHSVYTIQ
ncbi:hypothetical protein C0J52_22836 [Blattella germanica]|nr:hypothetical protein C0J52_22836 [Blattella germanica]